jgi:hypothetical protein
LTQIEECSKRSKIFNHEKDETHEKELWVMGLEIAYGNVLREHKGFQRDSRHCGKKLGKGGSSQM